MMSDFPLFSVHRKLRVARRDPKRGVTFETVWQAEVFFPRRVFRREAKDAEEARNLLSCLRSVLAARPGPTVPVIEEWERGGFCGVRVR